MKYFRLFTIILGLWAPAVASAQNSATDNPWPAITIADLSALEGLVRADHPGPADQERPEFSDLLAHSLARARGMAGTVDSLAGYIAVMNYATAQFRDEHLTFRSRYVPVSAAWAGIVLGYDGGAYVVRSTDPSWPFEALPKVGAVLQGCNDRTADVMMSEDVFRFGGYPGLESSHMREAPRLLADLGNPFVTRPSKCIFDENGATRDVTLSWKRERYDVVAGRLGLFGRDSGASFGARPTADGHGLWVTLPNFSPSNAVELAAMDDIFARLKAHAGKADRYVVFDVRGGGGGDSSWGEQVFEAAFGDKAAKTALDYVYDGVYVDWRVSEHNIARAKRILAWVEKNSGRESSDYVERANLLADMEAAQAKGEAMVRQGVPAAAKTRPSRPKVAGKVFLLTSATCVSACLDFADLVRAIDNAVHVGLPTAADSVYMEAEVTTLPSRLGSAMIASKVYRHRIRGWNEPYVPRLRWEGDINDTPAVEAWIGGLAANRSD